MQQGDQAQKQPYASVGKSEHFLRYVKAKDARRNLIQHQEGKNSPVLFSWVNCMAGKNHCIPFPGRDDKKTAAN